MASVTTDREYILGTREQETLRLGIQHDAWAPIARQCWERAGVATGDRIIDLGAGPGFAAFDLAEIVGERGHVTAIERSARFIKAGQALAAGRGIRNVDFVEMDLMTDAAPAGLYDASWCRWVASFVESPAALVDTVAATVRPGGVAMFHEYVDYASWRFSPSLPRVEEYITLVMRNWRDAGGEPDVATSIPPLLMQHGFTIEHAEPRAFCVRPGDRLWTWISTFIGSNLGRLVELKVCDQAWAQAVRREFIAAEADPSTLMITPMVLEIIARRSGACASRPCDR